MSDFVLKILGYNTELIQMIMELNSKYWYLLFVYIAPSFLALVLKKHNLRAIVACNLLLGFTGITWFVIFFWSLIEVENKPNKPVGDLCPKCKELIRSGAKKCHHCHSDV